ncbi:MAG: gliding motility-associated C-terminal domain-containing protein [Chitinophagales bacterium]|jgi:gliding motility-associated-like protein|nr:gliding motility-associated C-terminal domain-containing protein [Chitinophagales bacterium]
MKQIVKFSSVLFLLMFCVNSFSQSNTIGGSEFVFRNIDPNNPNLMEVTLLIYVPCDASAPTEIPSVRMVYTSVELCEHFSELVELSENTQLPKVITPICGFNSVTTQCDAGGSSSPNVGLRMHAYVDTVELPGLATDWRVAVLFDNGEQNIDFILNNNAQGLIAANPAFRPIFTNRYRFANMANVQNNLIAYNEALVSNKNFNGQKFVSNNTARTSIYPIFNVCQFIDRTIDFGYFDEDGDVLEFEFAPYFIDASPANVRDITNRSLPTSGTYNPVFRNFQFPIGNGILELDPNTGVMTYRPGTDMTVGTFKYTIKVTEKRKDLSGNLQVVGYSYKDLYFIVQNSPDCRFPIIHQGSNSDFLPVVDNIVNGALVSGTTIPTIEACTGNNLSFRVRAESWVPLSNLAVSIDIKDMDTMLSNAGANIVSSYVDGNHLQLIRDTASGIFSVNLPSHAKPGLYPVTFKVKTCTDGYDITNLKTVLIRINDSTRISWSYNNEKIKEFVLNPNVVYGCDNGPIPLLYASNGLDKYTITWSSACPNLISFEDNDGQDRIGAKALLDITGQPASCFVIATSNQYCLNKDTILVRHATPMNSQLEVVSTQRCYNDRIDLKVSNTPVTARYYWQTDLGFVEEPSIYSNEASLILDKKSISYRIFVVNNTDTCVEFFGSGGQEVEGILPQLDISADKTGVCPNETIKFTTRVNTSICGLDDFNQPTGPEKQAQFNNVFVSTAALPRTFAANGTIRFLRTQSLYRAEELIKEGFEAGIIKSIGYNFQNITNPSRYKNLTIKVICTDLINLENQGFVPDSTMILLASKPLQDLVNGWNDIVFDRTFTWDGRTSLIFQVQAECVDSSRNDPGAATMFEHVTPYISTIGSYSNNRRAWSPNPTATGAFRQNIRFTYQDIDPSSILFDWKPTLNNISTIDNPSLKNVSVTARKRDFYELKATYGKCVNTKKILADIDSNYFVHLDNFIVNKCATQKVQVQASAGIINQRFYDFGCGPVAFTAKPEDTTYSGFIGLKTTTTTNSEVSPYGNDQAVQPTTTTVTDKRVQYIFTKNEIRNSLASSGITKGLIQYIVIDSFIRRPNVNALNNFSVKIRCLPDKDSIFYNDNFDNSSDFTEVFYEQRYFPGNRNLTSNKDTIYFQKAYSWNDTSHILIDICFDNISGNVYNPESVRVHTLPRINNVNINRSLFRSQNQNLANNPQIFPCSYLTGKRSNLRPNIIFGIVNAKPNPPSVPLFYTWGPSIGLSNSRISNPIVFHGDSITYKVIVDYIDTFRNVDTLKCRVDTVLTVNVTRPNLTFLPNPVGVCAGDSVFLRVSSDSLPFSRYKYQWEAALGIDSAYLNRQNIFVKPLKRDKYYKVKIEDVNDSTCWNIDSISINIQNRKPMPDIGTQALICPGQSYRFTIPDSLGYKNVKWYFEGNFIDTGYVFHATRPGFYEAQVDSGFCSNFSRVFELRSRNANSVKLIDTFISICQGQAANIRYDLSSGVSDLLWNNGSKSIINTVTEPGLYYVIRAKDQFGCNMIVDDTARVVLVENNDFSLNSDSFCIESDGFVRLEPKPFHPNALYTWTPSNTTGNFFEARRPGTYTVVRNLNGCLKSASTEVIQGSYGKLNLGNTKLICCDEVVRLNANPENKPYTAYKWAIGNTNQEIIIPTRVSARYFVEAIRENGCKDTGSVQVISKCINLKEDSAYDKILFLGDTNKLKATYDSLENTNISFVWQTFQQYNNGIIFNGRSNTEVLPIDTGDAEYILTVKIQDTRFLNEEACQETVVYRFRVIPSQIQTFNGLTPNGDGINDSYYPVLEGEVQILDFKVINRYGQKLHDNPDIPWNGFYEGQKQPAGVYLALIKYRVMDAMKGYVEKFLYDNIVIID